MRRGRILQWATFNNIITDHENDTAEIEGLYRNERGEIYVPHTRVRLPLGTLAVENYARPEWAYNKVLYCEKSGFFQTLMADNWPERHDCVLMTSQGYASRAAKDFIDNLGGGDEPIQFFCLHDADADGTNDSRDARGGHEG